MGKIIYKEQTFEEVINQGCDGCCFLINGHCEIPDAALDVFDCIKPDESHTVIFKEVKNDKI